jgi:hypothetical protein
MAHGCKRADGFVDSGCNANCDCHVTMQRPDPLNAVDAFGYAIQSNPALRELMRSTPPWEIPNRLYGATINSEGEAI